MSWNKIDVEGRVMWESPDGQRVRDPADIPEQSLSHSPSSPEESVIRLIWAVGLIVGFVLGMVVGRML